MNLIDIIRSIDKGRASIELEAALSEVSKAVIEHRVKGEITFKLIVKPTGDGVEMTASIKAKSPKRELKPAVFFVTEEGELTREDPNQPELPAITKMESANA